LARQGTGLRGQVEGKVLTVTNKSGGYVGSRMSYRFLKKYQQLLELPTPPA